MAAYLARDCPFCGYNFGVVIAKPNGSDYRPIHGAAALAAMKSLGRSPRPESPQELVQPFFIYARADV